MKITEARLRTIIRKELLREAMYTPIRAAMEDLTFSAARTSFGKGGWEISCHLGRSIIGAVRIQRTLGIGACRGAYEVTMSDVSSDFSGLGPLLYDIAMELAGDAGIMSDRRMVSPAASAVWRRYLEDRSDVDHEQLDSLPGTITPYDPSDDCKQTRAQQDGNWRASPLSKVYKKDGTPVLDKLLDLGIIEIAG